MKKYLIILALISLLLSCDAKDSCLDSGGSYNDKTDLCENDH